jgi:rod shape-determining protein MreC
VVLMFVDHRSRYLSEIRSAAAIVVYPLQLVAEAPGRVAQVVSEYFREGGSLRLENEEIRHELLESQARLSRLESLEVENERLRRLLGASEKVAERALIAELVEVSLEPFTHRILVSKGSLQSVFVGQPVVDANGVMGQITEVTFLTATATLVTDPSSAIPTQVRRNGLRAIAFGTGAPGQIEISHLVPTADIETGDVLVTSGFGGHFPPGYPVARVVEIRHDAGESYLTVLAEPLAKLQHAREVLLIWPGSAPGGQGG